MNRVSIIAQGRLGAPRVSGNGKVVVWDQVVPSGQNQIFKYENGQVSRVTHDPRPDVYPAVNDDGSVIAWSRWSSADPNDQTATFDVYQNRGGVESPIFVGPGHQTNVAVSRDGKVVAYDDDEDGSMTHFNIHKWENGNLTNITQGHGNNQFPMLTADGQTIMWRAFDGQRVEVKARRPDGSTDTVLSANSDVILPAVTPDGSAVLWADDKHGDNDLYLTRNGQTTLVAGERMVDEVWGRMSADGNQIVYTSFDRRHAGNADCEVKLKEGEQTTSLSKPDGGIHAWADISDDGKTIAWLRIDPDDRKPSKIYLLERDVPAPSPPQQPVPSP
jgi:Tol biopolymer transport system component